MHIHVRAAQVCRCRISDWARL